MRKVLVLFFFVLQSFVVGYLMYNNHLINKVLVKSALTGHVISSYKDDGVDLNIKKTTVTDEFGIEIKNNNVENGVDIQFEPMRVKLINDELFYGFLIAYFLFVFLVVYMVRNQGALYLDKLGAIKVLNWKKILFVLICLVLFFLLLNPSLKDFSQYKHGINNKSCYCKKELNFYVFSVYKPCVGRKKGIRYLGVLGNFFAINRVSQSR